MAWGFFHNVFEKATGYFGKKTSSFSDYWKGLKTIFKAPDKVFAYKKWRESINFWRMKPFMEKMPGSWQISGVGITPTPLMLPRRFQYIFQVNFRYKGDAKPEQRFFSFMSEESMTVSEAKAKMDTMIKRHENRKKYQQLDDMEILFSGVRQNVLF